MTLAELAAIKTFTRDENGDQWDRFMELAPEGDRIAPENREALLALVSEAPLTFRRPAMLHADCNEFIGFYPWQRDNGSIGLVSISICDDNAVCMSDAFESEMQH